MNGSDRKKRYYTTPRGEALFARLVDPDYGTERYPDPRGSFHVTLALGAEEARRLDALLKPALEEAREFASRKAGQNRDKTGGPELSFAAPGIPERDREGSFTDRRLYRFRTNAFYQQPGGCRTRRVVPVFNAALERMELFREPGNGSLARVAFSVAPYFIEATGVAGLSLFLDSVQILRLNRRGGLTGEEYGFCVETPDPDRFKQRGRACRAGSFVGAPRSGPVGFVGIFGNPRLRAACARGAGVFGPGRGVG